MNTFKKFYLWAMNAKFYMGLYFAALVFLSGLLSLIFGVESIGIITLLQMLIVSLVIAFIQVFLLPDSMDFTRKILYGRSICWLLIATALTTGAAFWGGWLSGMPAWCPWLLGIFMLIGCAAILIGVRFEQEAATIHLNEALEQYQNTK